VGGKALSREISDKLLDHYFALMDRALASARIAPPPKSHLRKTAEDFLSFAKNYRADALHLRNKGDYPRALGAVYYAHAWLDAGARLGLFDVGGDSELFTLAE
jgi:hypothetical protein